MTAAHAAESALPSTRLPNGLELFHLNAGETRALYQEIFEDRCYLQHGIRLVPGAVILDVGANIGMSSLFFAAHAPGCQIHCFEPVPAIFEVLEANIARHGLPARAHALAMAGAAGERELLFYPNNSVMSGLHVSPDEDAAVTSRFMLNSGFELDELAYFLETKFHHQRLRCRTTAFSEFCQAEGIERVDLLKIDVEKAEWEVLQGVQAADWRRIRQVVVEVHDANGRLRDIRALLGAQGFRVEVGASALLAGTGLHDVYATRD